MTIKNNSISRRNILKIFPAGAALALSACSNGGTKSSAIIPVDFNHGVASGDPLHDRVIIWTRVTAVEPSHAGNIDVTWQISSDADFSKIIKSGVFTTDSHRDFTVKEDVTGLKSGQHYFYRFNVGDITSPIGETQTLKKAGTDPVRLAVVSCSNYPWGYFNGYRAISEMGPFDAVLHLGDYIYEYEEGRYAAKNSKEMGRMVDPPHQIKTLSDYRLRYALYRGDEDLQELHRKFPFICAWDDHEFANNAYATGSLDNDKEGGNWAARRRAAQKAFMEWLPVRVSDDLPTVRSFTFGKLATLAMLDTRIVGRERPLDYNVDVEWQKIEISDNQGGKISVPRAFDGTKEITDPDILRDLREDNLPEGWKFKRDYAAFHKRLETEERSMIGAHQEVWLDKTLAKSGADGIPWQIIGQQVIMSYRPEPPLSSVFTPQEMEKFSAGEQLSMAVAEEYGGFFNPDAWDGYQPARRRVFDMLEKHAGNPIVLSGDTHCAWAMSLMDKPDGRHYGAEFAVQGITSPGRGDRIGKVAAVEQSYYDHLPHMAYASILGRGFMTLTISEADTTANWYFVSTVDSHKFDLSLRKSLRYNLGDNADGKVTLEDVTPPRQG